MGVRFQSITEAINTQTPTGPAMWQMSGLLAELERSLITEGTRAGVKTARVRGVRFGRKQKLSPAHVADAQRKIAAGYRPGDVAKFFKVSRAKLYRALQ